MTDFRFLHAADIHLDSPLHGLSRYEGLPVDEIRSATRSAFDNLIDRALEEQVDFVVIAGDLFDGDWRDMGTGLYFARAMGRLDRAGIPAFILAGNHDAASSITRTLTWPPNVRLFSPKHPETHTIPHLAVALHGQSFSTPAVSENLVLAYPAADPASFNIGVLHTALSGRPGHANYAPCTVEDLRGMGYDYWALGHVHEFEIVAEHPHIVFPGNVQGRTIRETGPKGAVIVSVEDGLVQAVERVDLGVVRWMRLEVDCTTATLETVPDLIRTELTRLHGANSNGQPMIVRVTVGGTMTGAGTLLDGAEKIREEVRAMAVAISPDLHIEKVKVSVTEPGTGAEAVLGDDLDKLIGDASADPELLATIEADLARFLATAKSALNESEDGELHMDATRGDWQGIVKTASTALRSRLAGGA